MTILLGNKDIIGRKLSNQYLEVEAYGDLQQKMKIAY